LIAEDYGLIRRNRFDAVGQALVFAAGVIVALVFVSIMIMEFENSRKLSDVVNQNMIEMTALVKDSEIMMYDGVKVTGADVLNFGKKHFYGSSDSGSFAMVVISGSGTSVEINDRDDMKAVVRASAAGTSLDALNSPDPGTSLNPVNNPDPGMIDPMSYYIGEVIQNENGIITSVTFRYMQI